MTRKNFICRSHGKISLEKFIPVHLDIEYIYKVVKENYKKWVKF